MRTRALTVKGCVQVPPCRYPADTSRKPENREEANSGAQISTIASKGREFNDLSCGCLKRSPVRGNRENVVGLTSWNKLGNVDRGSDHGVHQHVA